MRYTDSLIQNLCMECLIRACTLRLKRGSCLRSISSSQCKESLAIIHCSLQEAVADMTDQVQNFKRRTADLDIQNVGLKTKLEESNTLLAKADKENGLARQKQQDLEISLADSVQQVMAVSSTSYDKKPRLGISII